MAAELHDKRADVIALLGIDGSGKTTLAHRLVECIRARDLAGASEEPMMPGAAYRRLIWHA